MAGRLPLDDYLAVERTRLANERTMLAYVRTAFAFVAGGLTLALAVQGRAARIGGLVLVALGGLTLIVGLWRYHRVRQRVERAYAAGPPEA